jgi:hypothetical protein
MNWARFYMDAPITEPFDWRITPDSNSNKSKVLIYWPVVRIKGGGEALVPILEHIAAMDSNDFMWNAFFKEAYQRL